ncbi:13498_t:CDS:2, partial [Gigaspora margarita]
SSLAKSEDQEADDKAHKKAIFFARAIKSSYELTPRDTIKFKEGVMLYMSSPNSASGLDLNMPNISFATSWFCSTRQQIESLVCSVHHAVNARILDDIVLVEFGFNAL